MLACLALSRAELSVVITDDREIRELNNVFRHRNRATDVLAFAMREGKPLGKAPLPNRSGEMLGDVVLSVETARRQATQQRRPLAAEMRMLLAHGLLHLVGYDHQSAGEEAIMTAETERLCGAAGRSSARRARSGRDSTPSARNEKLQIPGSKAVQKRTARRAPRIAHR